MSAAPCVLVVEDEQDFVNTYERLLRRQGLRVIAAGSRREGLAALGSERLALVIADLRLPDGDGLDVVRAARTTPAPPSVIVVTGYASEDGRQAALAAGASAYVAKPFATASFLTLIQKVLAAAPPGSAGGGSGDASLPR